MGIPMFGNRQRIQPFISNDKSMNFSFGDDSLYLFGNDTSNCQPLPSWRPLPDTSIGIKVKFEKISLQARMTDHLNKALLLREKDLEPSLSQCFLVRNDPRT